MAKMERAERLLKLIQVLQSGGARTAGELAKLVGVSRRTVFRDLEVLAQVDVPYEFDRVTRRYSAEQTALLPPVNLKQAEALALLLATRGAVGRSIISDDEAASAALKVEGMLPQALQDYCEPLLELIEIRPEPTSAPASVHATLSTLQSALTDRAKIRVRYHFDVERRNIDVVLHPVKLAHIRRAWYLIALVEGGSELGTYKVARILHLEVLPEHCRTDPVFSLDHYFGNAWLMKRGDKRYHVKIRFTPTVAAAVEEVTWHKTQRTTYEADGSLLFEADPDGIKEISWWVLGYGEEAEVLGPPELRELLAGHARRMCGYYRGCVESADRGAVAQSV